MEDKIYTNAKLLLVGIFILGFTMWLSIGKKSQYNSPDVAVCVSEKQNMQTDLEARLDTLISDWKRGIQVFGGKIMCERGEDMRRHPVFFEGYYFAVAVKPTDKTNVLQIVAYAHPDPQVLNGSGFVQSEISKSMLVTFP